MAAEERAALISALMQERLYWRSRETGLAAPVLATVAGVVGTAVGAALVVGGNDDGHNRGMVNAGIGTSITGVVSFITGIALFCYRTANSTQAEEIRKIDRKLDTLGIPARVMPWLSTGAHASAGLTLKMSL